MMPPMAQITTLFLPNTILKLENYGYLFLLWFYKRDRFPCQTQYNEEIKKISVVICPKTTTSTTTGTPGLAV